MKQSASGDIACGEGAHTYDPSSKNETYYIVRAKSRGTPMLTYRSGCFDHDGYVQENSIEWTFLNPNKSLVLYAYEIKLTIKELMSFITITRASVATVYEPGFYTQPEAVKPNDPTGLPTSQNGNSANDNGITSIPSLDNLVLGGLDAYNWFRNWFP